MEPKRVRGATGAALGAVALLLLVTVAAPGAGAASNGQPAFTTFEAPGGATTAGQRVIALTFDDGPGPYTPQVLSVLERYRVPATFFEIGEEVADYPQYSKTVAAAGFPVEDHTWSHPNLTTIPASSIASQIDMTQAEIRAVTGTTPQCVRPPYDAWNATVLSQSRRPRANDDELLRRSQGLEPPGHAGDREQSGRRRVPRCRRRPARRRG